MTNLDLGVVPDADVDIPQSSVSLDAAALEVGSTSQESADEGVGAADLLGLDRSPPLFPVTEAQESAAAPQSSSFDLLALGVALPPPLGAALAPVAHGELEGVDDVPQSSEAGAALVLETALAPVAHGELDVVDEVPQSSEAGAALVLETALAPVAHGELDEVDDVPQSSEAGAVLVLARGVDRPLPDPGLGQSRAMCPSWLHCLQLKMSKLITEKYSFKQFHLVTSSPTTTASATTTTTSIGTFTRHVSFLITLRAQEVG